VRVCVCECACVTSCRGRSTWSCRWDQCRTSPCRNLHWFRRQVGCTWCSWLLQSCPCRVQPQPLVCRIQPMGKKRDVKHLEHLTRVHCARRIRRDEERTKMERVTCSRFMIAKIKRLWCVCENVFRMVAYTSIFVLFPFIDCLLSFVSFC
jgi:hypothetical protein